VAWLARTRIATTFGEHDGMLAVFVSATACLGHGVARARGAMRRLRPCRVRRAAFACIVCAAIVDRLHSVMRLQDGAALPVACRSCIWRSCCVARRASSLVQGVIAAVRRCLRSHECEDDCIRGARAVRFTVRRVR